jgi:hypothetical protein
MDDKQSELTGQWRIAKKFYVLTFAFATFLGLVGGAVGGWLFASRALRSSNLLPTGEMVIPVSGLLFKTNEGRTVARLLNLDQGGSFTIFNAEGQAVVDMQSYMGGGSIALWNDEHVIALNMTAEKDGGRLGLFDITRGKNTILMYPGKDGGAIDINDGHGDSVVKLGVDRKGGKIETFTSELK